MAEKRMPMHARSNHGIKARRKWQTRRIVKGVPPEYVTCEVVGPWCHFYDELSEPNQNGVRSGNMFTVKCPYGRPGDTLLVAEAWRTEKRYDAWAAFERQVKKCQDVLADPKPPKPPSMSELTKTKTAAKRAAKRR